MTPSLRFVVAALVVVHASSVARAQAPGVTSSRAQIEIGIDVAALVPGQLSTLRSNVRNADGSDAIDQRVELRSLDTTRLRFVNATQVRAFASGPVLVEARQGALSKRLLVIVDEGGVVGPEGGVVSAFGGAVQLDVPAGAFPGRYAIRIARGTTTWPEPTIAAGSRFTISMSLAAFTQPVTVRLTYSVPELPYGLPESDVAIRQLTDSVWQDRASTPGMASGSISAPIVAPGTYAVGRRTPAAPCTGAPHRAFGFWLGTWEVSANGQFAGRNEIRGEPGGCAIFESFRDAAGRAGRSISFYDPTTERWYQTYVNDAGQRLRVSGELSAAGTLTMMTPRMNSRYERWSWTLNPDGSVQQVADATQDGGATFGPPSWNGRYVKR